MAIKLIDSYIDIASKYDLSFFTRQPRCIIVSILITAAFIVGAYFIGKNRKAGKIGKEFMFKSVRYVLSLTLIAMIIGAVSLNFYSKKGIVGILIVLLMSFLIHIILELSQNKSFKGFWKTVLRFAVIFGACFAFMTIVRTTNAFNFYKKLPSENSIKEVRVSGMYFYTDIQNYSDTEYHIYKAESSILEILSEHKKLLSVVIAGGIMCLVSEVIYLPKLKELPKSILCCFAAMVISIGIVMLFNKTGSFGLRYFPEDAENIEYLKIDDNCIITDKEDIKQYLKKHNNILKNYADNLMFGDYSIEYQTADGKMIRRGYSKTGYYGSTDPLGSMIENVKSLNGYGKYFFAEMDNIGGEWDYLIVGENEGYDIPKEREEEFIGILREEAETKYDPDAEIYARVEFSGSSLSSFYIQKDFKKPSLFLKVQTTLSKKTPIR